MNWFRSTATLRRRCRDLERAMRIVIEWWDSDYVGEDDERIQFELETALSASRSLLGIREPNG